MAVATRLEAIAAESRERQVLHDLFKTGLNTLEEIDQMKKSLTSAVAVALGMAGAMSTTTASAAFILDITPGTHDCLVAADPTHWTGCSFGAPTNVAGSNFSMGGNFANDLSSSVGLDVDGVQPFVGTAPSSGNALDPSLAGGNITDPWLFFSLTQYGVNYTTSPISLTDDGAGGALADMSGWRVAWSEVPEINMGGGAPGALTYDNVAKTWSLDYSAVVPDGDPSGFGGTAYDLHLEGTFTGDITSVIAPAAVPVPAAVWLFGSGLVGLVGVARRKKTG